MPEGRAQRRRLLRKQPDAVKRRNTGHVYDPNALLLKTILRVDEAAFLLDVSPRTVQRYMTDGKLEFRRTPGGRRRLLTESLKKYL